MRIIKMQIAEQQKAELEAAKKLWKKAKSDFLNIYSAALLNLKPKQLSAFYSLLSYAILRHIKYILDHEDDPSEQVYALNGIMFDIIERTLFLGHHINISSSLHESKKWREENFILTVCNEIDQYPLLYTTINSLIEQTLNSTMPMLFG